MADVIPTLVRLLHVFFGVVWVGGSVFFGHSVVGGLRKQPPQVMGPAMMAIQGKMFTLFLVAGPATVAFGVWNQYLMAGTVSYQGGAWNMILGAALVLSLAAIGVAVGNNLPAFRRMKAAFAASGGRPTAEIEGLRKRVMAGGIVMTALVVLALVLMVLAVLRGPTRVA